MAPLALVTTRKLHLNWLQIWSPDGNTCIGSKEAAASEAAGQTKEEFSGNDTSRHPKVLKVGPKLGCQ